MLEQRLKNDPNRPILKTLYDRYTKVEVILSNNEDVYKIMISGGCRAYLDAFSDYMNPLLAEMDKAEKMILFRILNKKIPFGEYQRLDEMKSFNGCTFFRNEKGAFFLLYR